MKIQHDRIEQRLRELTTEIAKGKQQLQALEQRRTEIEQTLLRLSGAVQVLSELRQELMDGELPDTHQELPDTHDPNACRSTSADPAPARSAGPSVLAAEG